MNHRVIAAVVFAQFMDLSMAVVAACDAVIRARGFDLLILDLAVGQSLFLEPGLQESAAATAAVIVGAVGLHVDEVFFTHHGFDYKPQVFGNGVAKAFADDLAGILNRELDFQILVPVGIDLELAFPDPFGIVFVNVFDFKLVFQVEFFQSGPD
jgi:hypothetical protein